MPFPNENTQFKKGRSGNPTGRPPKLVSSINTDLKAQGYREITKAEAMSAIQTLVNLPEAKLIEIANDKEAAMLFRIAAKELMGKRGSEYMERLMDRSLGKPKQDADDALPPPTTQRAVFDFGFEKDGVTRITIEI